jgi:glycolate oxidase iron-sulfur subunit
MLTRGLLTVMGSKVLRGAFFSGGRVLRATGLAGAGARLLPASGPLANARLALAMLASSAPGPSGVEARTGSGPTSEPDTRAEGVVPSHEPSTKDAALTGRVGVLLGCVQAGLYGRVNRATVRTLTANGFEVVGVHGQDCCGALHAHGGDLDGARVLARTNIEAFESAGVDLIVANASGCGAAMKEYGTLFERDPEWSARASAVAERVRDVTELLADAGPRTGAPITMSVAYDHPCHLLHAQRVERAPLQVLAAIPGVDVRVIAGADECCGGAGIYGMTHPELGGRIGSDKIDAVQAANADVACTPNPGCMMQIGAGLRLRDSHQKVVHPVELLDESYERAGYYR